MKNIFLIIFFLTSVGISSGHAQFLFMEDQLQGKPAPDFKLPKLSGGSQTLTEFRDGKKVIVFFWATWCPHCREQLSAMNLKVDEMNQKGIKIAAVDLGENEKTARNFLKNKNIKLDIFVDEKSLTEELYNLIGVPTLVFIDEKGIVQGVKHSFPDKFDQMFETKSVPIK